MPSSLFNGGDDQVIILKKKCSNIVQQNIKDSRNLVVSYKIYFFTDFLNKPDVHLFTNVPYLLTPSITINQLLVNHKDNVNLYTNFNHYNIIQLHHSISTFF